MDNMVVAKKACQIFSVMSSNSFSISFFVTVMILLRKFLPWIEEVSGVRSDPVPIEDPDITGFKLWTKFSSSDINSHQNRLICLKT